MGLGVRGLNTSLTQIFDDEESSIFAGLPPNQVVEHFKALDYYKLDRKYFPNLRNYDTMEESGWWYVKIKPLSFPLGI